MSLRARLVGALLVVSALGLLTLAAVTYAEQRSFLLERADQQARSAVRVANRALRGPPPGDAQDGVGGGPAGVGGFVPGDARPGGPRRPRTAGRAGRGGPPEVSLPAGTYAERRNASGGRIGEPVVLSFGNRSSLSPPELPARLPEEARTVPSEDGSLRYRVRAQESPNRRQTTVVAVPLREADQTLDRLLVVLGLVIAGVLGALAVLSHFLVRVGLRPLDRIGTTAGAIAAGDLSRRVAPATPATEVGRLGIALNAMLERLEQAFAQREAGERRLRQFLADASHELRTPLSSIRGYAELFRMGAARSPADVSKAMRRIEEEASRMGVLVEDLLQLARLDEVRNAAREEVDFADLADDLVHDARAADQGRAISLTAADGARVWGNADQLRQVLGNLLRNALVHTPAGTPVEVSVTRGAGRVRAVVRDHGPGLPVDDPLALFQRFWRAGGGRRRGPAGAGLGLAIVAGIVAAHDGEVTARDAPGGGAEFVVELPEHVSSAGGRAAPAPEAGRPTPEGSGSATPGAR